MKITIVIPIFRTERTLRRCVDSIARQTFADWEMVLVDDGSDDGSAAICDEYASSDNRIRVIHQENKGLGAARNRGIEESTGDCLMFVDSDDSISGTTLAELADIMTRHEEYDFVEFAIVKHYGNNATQERTAFTDMEFSNKWDYWFNAQAYTHSYACNKIFRRRVFDKVRFRENKKFEDMFTIPDILDASNRFATTSCGTYFYYDNPDGITATAGRGLSDLLEAHLHVLGEKLQWKRPGGISRKAFGTYYANVVNIQIDVYDRCGAKSIALPTLPYFTTPKLIILHITGIRLLCLLTKLYHRLCKTNR